MRTLRIILIVSCCCILSGCNGRIQRYTDFLYANMSFADSVCTTRAYWEANVRCALEARKEAGWKVPEKEFRHYVLPVRVNNEPLDSFRFVYGPMLLERVKGLGAADAVLEINHWCHEQASYSPSDGRTCSPLQTILRKTGRCGEESVLAVAALRAVGLPARQVYTPRWAQTDDNHAWVEVYVDGRWWFMGACEPAPTLNNAWFNGPVSRAMLLHTKAFGHYEGDEDIISRAADYTEINVTAGYVDTHRSEVQVLDTEGNPVEGATVEFCIYNYAELYSVASFASDSEGKAGLTTGKGDLIVRAQKDGLFGIAKLNGTGAVVLDKNYGEPCSFDFHIVPPPENPIPVHATDAQIAENARRLAMEDSIRAARPAHRPVIDPSISSLSEKDLMDVDPAVLADAIGNAPRVELENLVPYFGEIRRGLDSLELHFSSKEEVREWVDANIKIDPVGNPRRLRIPPVYVWRSRMADPLSRDIFYVALCRAAGFEAEYDSVLGQIEDSSYATARIELRYKPLPWLAKPLYYRHFTLSRIVDGKARLVALDEDRDWDSHDIAGLNFEPGYYLLTSGIRLADGSVQCHLEFFHLETKAEVPLILKTTAEEGLPVIGSIDAEMTYLPEGTTEEVSILSTVGRGNFLLAVLGRNDEPSSHARRELSAAADALKAWGRPVLVIDPAAGMADPDGKVARMLDRSCEGSNGRLPLIAVCDSFGRVFYISRGYNTSLAADLESILPRL